MELIKN